jgi:ribose 5-phosphate isomerase A
LSPSAPARPRKEVEAARDRVAEAALALVEDGMVVGLGTGDTARRFIEQLARRVRDESLKLTCVVTSGAAAGHARAGGLKVTSLIEAPQVDLAVDGADEVSPALDLIKGGGGAHTREKLVAASAARFIVLVDETKLVHRLGEGFPVPLEVLAEAVQLVERRVAALGANTSVRAYGDAPFVTELGNRILDAHFGVIADAAALAAQLDGIPGVLEHGLFIGMASMVLVGDLATETVRRLVPSGAERTRT